MHFICSFTDPREDRRVLKVIYSCLTQQHDMRLVALAGFTCIFACVTAVNLFLRAREAIGKRRLALVSGAAAVFGAGVWATHFVAELAFEPGLPVAYDIDLSALSLVIAMVLTWFGMVVAVCWQKALLGGGFVGLAIGAMHYVGMAALRVPADLRWDPSYVGASLAVGVVLAAAAIWLAYLGSAWQYRLSAAALLAAAICGLHFTAMAAIALTPDPLIAMPDNFVPPGLLAVPVAAVTVSIVMLGISASLIEQQRDRQAAQEAEMLRRSQEHLARAQRIAHTGSDLRNMRTDEAEWSDETYRIFGVSRDTYVPSTANFLRMLHPDDRALVLATRDQIKNGICPDPFEYRIIRPDGTLRHIYRENELIRGEAGRPLYVAGTIQDVTEIRAAQAREKDLERQLMHSQKLEALGTLAGGVAHDLNNTLVPILALSKLALDELPPASPVRGDIETIARASERARDLVKQVLAFSRKQDFVRDRVDLAAVAREALQMLRASLPATIRIDEQIAAVPPLFGDAGELHQAIVNLVTNAAQAIGAEAGTITVGVGTVGADTVGVDTLRADTLLGGGARGGGAPTHAAPHHAETAIRLSVADTGCGIDPATLDRIFEPFFTTKMVGEGTGLGLSVVHGIVTRHGGHIAIHSRPGLGSVFTIALPAIAQPTIAQPAIVQPAIAQPAIAQPATPVPSQTDRPFETAAA
jgi:PAS domain S-box-containing protein